LSIVRGTRFVLDHHCREFIQIISIDVQGTAAFVSAERQRRTGEIAPADVIQGRHSRRQRCAAPRGRRDRAFRATQRAE
jgi:hypothetical protein